MRSAAALSVPRLRAVRAGEVPPHVAMAAAERKARRAVATLTFSVATLTVLGLVMVLSASSVTAFAQTGSSFTFFKRQLVYAVMGCVLAAGTARVSYRIWHRAWPALLGGSLLLLLLVLTPAGIQSGGASRWIAIGSFNMQPSELAKFAVVVAASSILARNARHLDEPILWLIPLALVVGSVSLLILFQRDLGTMAIVVASVFLLMFVAGVRARVLITSATVSGVVGFGLIMVEGYRRARLLSFLHPWADRQNTGYQIVQSLIALGSGHLTGVGLGASRQKWMYVPNAHTDFIFSILGEELGLIGELCVLALFAALIYAGIRIAIRAPDAFGRLLGAGIVGWLGVQALINLGGATGVLPITGVPLPFISFGGSSLVVSLGAVGVLLSIGRAEIAGAAGTNRSAPGGKRRTKAVPAKASQAAKAGR
jgi:cell division protein FtsW